MIKAAFFHKVLGISAGLISVFVIAAVLSPEVAEYYFTSMSAIQISIPFVGLGLSQFLVSRSIHDNRVKISASDIALIVISALLFVVVLYILGLDYYTGGNTLFIYLVIYLLLVFLSELYRATFVFQAGFVVINLIILALSFWVMVSKAFHSAMVVLPMLGLMVVLILLRRTAYKFELTKSGLSFNPFISILRSLRVSVFNQYYHIVIVLLALFGGLSESLLLILIYRLNVIFNWQAFYWLRFAHKQTVGGVTDESKKENFKVFLISITLIFLANTAFIAGDYLGIFNDIGIDFINKDFIKLALTFSVFKAVMSVTFPYELFTIYSKNERTANKLLILLGVLLIGVICLSHFLDDVFTILIIVEIVIIFARIVSWRLLNNDRK